MKFILMLFFFLVFMYSIYYYSNLLLLLLFLEMLMLILFFLYFFILSMGMNFSGLIYLLVFMVCESVLGLSLLVMMIRSRGEDLMMFLDLFLW